MMLAQGKAICEVCKHTLVAMTRYRGMGIKRRVCGVCGIGGIGVYVGMGHSFLGGTRGSLWSTNEMQAKEWGG